MGAPREGRDEQENECQCAANIKTGRGLQRLTTLPTTLSVHTCLSLWGIYAIGIPGFHVRTHQCA